MTAPFQLMNCWGPNLCLHGSTTRSRSPSYVALGEILQKRTFQASGEPNALAKREAKPTTFTVANDQLIATEEQTWQPRSLLAILDGLASVKWAYILLQIGPEKSVISFFDWAIKLARSRPQKTDQLNQWWTTISWKLALELRGGRTWEEAVGPIQRDYDTFTECMGREPIHIIKNPKLGGKTNTEVNPKGKGKHRQPQPHPYGRQHKGGYQQESQNQRSQPSSWTSTRRVRGAVINGTRVGPSPRNRDSTGSLSVLREGHPTTPQRRTQQTNLHQSRWCPTRLTCWGPALSSCPALMALQQDPWRCNSSLAHCGKSLHGRLTLKQFQCLGATFQTSSTVVTFSTMIPKTWHRQSTTSTMTVAQWWYGWGLHLAPISHPSRVTKHQVARAKKARSSSSFAPSLERLKANYTLSVWGTW